MTDIYSYWQAYFIVVAIGVTLIAIGNYLIILQWIVRFLDKIVLYLLDTSFKGRSGYYYKLKQTK